MPLHWTYTVFRPEDDLRQGDIVAPTDDLQSLFREVHKHFCDPKYIAFAVLTQSCDLVRRKGTCSARHINLAVVRSLESVLFDLLNGECETALSGVYYEESKAKARMLLERIFNQNEQSLGVFYLHPDEAAGIAVPAVVLLRIAIAFRSEHYERIANARQARLDPIFQNKLGWLVGNLYSRVATRAWDEVQRKELDKMVDGALYGGSETLRPTWVSRDCVELAERNGVVLESLQRGDIKAVLDRHKPIPPKEQAISHIKHVAKKMLPALTDEELNRLANRLRNDASFSQIFRRQSG